MNDLMNTQPTMTSLEIADLVEARHDNVKRTIERLVAAGVISQPPMEDGPKSANGVVTKVYLIGKRDSYVIVAQLSPEFTARLVDRWQQLEEQAAARPAPALPDFTDPAAAAIAWAEQFRAKQALAIENAAQAEQLAIAAPKAAALDRIAAGDEAVTLTEAAKLLSIKREKLTNWLHANGWCYRLNGR